MRTCKTVQYIQVSLLMGYYCIYNYQKKVFIFDHVQTFGKKNFLMLTLVRRLLILHLCLCSSFFPFFIL